MPYPRCQRNCLPDRQRHWNRLACQFKPRLRMWPPWAVCGRSGIAWKSSASIASTQQRSGSCSESPIVEANDEKREAVMKGSLLSALVLSAVVLSAAASSQTGADAMGKAIKADDIKWEPLEGGFEISILYTNPATQATYLVIRGPG